MHTSVLGRGYVGAPLAACLADLGHDVTAVDIDETVVERLNAGDPPIAEPRLDELYAEPSATGSGRRPTTTPSSTRA
jgi:UDPglucose 6-dehydrogenase